MTPSLFAQADLFGDGEEFHAPSLRAVGARAAAPKRERAASSPDPEIAARGLDAHDDYGVLRRPQPRPVDATYRPGPDEFIACIVDVETTGLDHSRHEVVEIGMAAFVPDAAGRIGPVVGVLGMLHEPGARSARRSGA